MIDKRLRNQITQLKLIISVAEFLISDRSIISLIKSGSKRSIRSLGGLISC
jgi:hypothetical protein